MPRKPGVGPPLLKIERLSDGVDPTLIDDFTGLAIAQPDAHAPAIPNAQAEHDRLNRERVAAQRAMLERTGILPSTVTQVSTGNGERPILSLPDGLVLTVPHKPFRRL